MLKKQYRYSFKQGLPGARIHSPYFVLRYGKQELGYARVAVVVGKTVDKSAVKRNRVKRVFTNTLEKMLKVNDKSFDLVFYLRKPIVNLNVEQLSETITKSLEPILI